MQNKTSKTEKEELLEKDFPLNGTTIQNSGAIALELDIVEESLSDQVKVMSPLQLVLKRFFRSKLSIAGLVMILFLFAFSFLGPLFRHINWLPVYEELERFSTDDILVMPFRRYMEDGITYFYYVTRTQLTYKRLSQPDIYNILGTDHLGHDIFSRLMYGGRISLGIAFLVIFISTAIGVLMGSIAGYFGKWVDQIIMRLVDLIMCIPQLPILLIIGAILDMYTGPPHNIVTPAMRIWLIMLVLTVFGWAGTARLVRGQILMLREQDYMLAAESMGLSASRRIFKHLIPNVMPQLIVSMTLGLGGVILAEASLSFLGFGVQEPFAAWGTMIGSLRYFHILTNHFHLWGPPGFLIMMAVLGFNFIGDGLRDAFDPKMKR
ncbi:MAG: ABC transporter permease [Firmicutes bacterium]|nr:ABC transporter permease [Bacillota bacterium]